MGSLKPTRTASVGDQQNVGNGLSHLAGNQGGFKKTVKAIDAGPNSLKRGAVLFGSLVEHPV